MKNKEINVKGYEIAVIPKNEQDYISLTDIARFKNKRTDDVIRNWLRTRNTLEFLGLWEKINNYCFKRVEFDGIRLESGLNSFSLTPKQWIEKTNSIGIISKAGRYGGTYAHKDIAIEFSSWISVEFKLYLIKEFQRLKLEEYRKKDLSWNLRRELTKINYKIHTDAIKNNLIPKELNKYQVDKIYAEDMALFGITAKEWKLENKEGNLRDYANLSQLICLLNLENLNALFIKEKINSKDRLIKLNKIAIEQMKILSKEHINLPKKEKVIKVRENYLKKLKKIRKRKYLKINDPLTDLY